MVWKLNPLCRSRKGGLANSSHREPDRRLFLCVFCCAATSYAEKSTRTGGRPCRRSIQKAFDVADFGVSIAAVPGSVLPYSNSRESTSRNGSSSDTTIRRQTRRAVASSRSCPRRPDHPPNQCPETQGLYSTYPYAFRVLPLYKRRYKSLQRDRFLFQVLVGPGCI